MEANIAKAKNQEDHHSIQAKYLDRVEQTKPERRQTPIQK
jgi:hypothetical protein